MILAKSKPPFGRETPKSSLALCSPCQRKSQSGCLSTQKTLPHHSWIQGQSEHVALAWGQQGSATGREVVTD